jgi:hypothetical protein
MPNIIYEENERMLARLRAALEAQGDGKFYWQGERGKSNGSGIKKR